MLPCQLYLKIGTNDLSLQQDCRGKSHSKFGRGGGDWLKNDSSPKGEEGEGPGGRLTLEPASPLSNFEGEVSLKIGQGEGWL